MFVIHKSLLRLCRVLFFIVFSLLVTNTQLFAQSSPEDVIQHVLQTPDDSKSRIIVLQFGTTGMTESSAKAFSTMIARNMDNTNRFEVVDLEEAESVVIKQDPTLLPCFEIGCGIQIGRIMDAERILTGHISLSKSGLFSLTIKLVHVLGNKLEFEDTIRFSDENMDRRFYQLSTRIAKNTPLSGNVLEANNKIAVISLGSHDGLSVGDQLVLYRQQIIEAEPFSMQGNSGKSRKKNIGILTITKVGKRSSEGVYFQSIENALPNQSVTTFLEKRKQIQLIDAVRKELDTNERNVYEIEKIVELSPVQLKDIEKEKWIRQVVVTQNSQSFWELVLMISGGVTGFVLYQYSDGDDLKLMASLGTVGYSALRFFSLRKEINDLENEGKFKGYIDFGFQPKLQKAHIGYQFKF